MNGKEFELLMHQLETLSKKGESHDEKLSAIQIDVAKLKTEFKVKSSLLGLVAGSVPAVIHYFNLLLKD